jgi:putative cell wall-binding protein
MKKIAVLVLLVVGISTFAQEKTKQDRKESTERLSPEQRNQLHLKKLTLELGLNESQQKDMSKIIADQSTKREAAMAEHKANKEKGIKPTADERFANQNQKLDDEIATKAKVQKILTPEQFKKWEAMKKDRQEHFEKKMEKKARKSPKSEE